MNVILQAVRDRLRSQLSGSPYSFDSDTIEIMPGPQPSAFMGQQWISVYGLAWAPPGDVDHNRALDEQFSVACCLSRKMGSTPYDRRGVKEYAVISNSMDVTLRRIMVSIHQEIDIITRANVLISGSYKMVEYLRWQDTDANPTEVPPEWFWADDPNMPVAGLMQEVRFKEARRIQPYASME